MNLNQIKVGEYYATTNHGRPKRGYGLYKTYIIAKDKNARNKNFLRVKRYALMNSKLEEVSADHWGEEYIKPLNVLEPWSDYLQWVGQKKGEIKQLESDKQKALSRMERAVATIREVTGVPLRAPYVFEANVISLDVADIEAIAESLATLGSVRDALDVLDF